MTGRFSVLQTLLWVFAGGLVVATILGLGLGFDLFVRPPAIADNLDLPTRLIAIQPFREARWPFEAIATLASALGFGALALAAGPLSALAGRDRRAGVLRSAILASGVIGVAANLLYLGATKVTIDLQYCDCGFKTQEVISQFWAIQVANGATDWLNIGAVAFGIVAVSMSAVLFDRSGLPGWWRWLAAGAALFLAVGVVLPLFSDSPLGDLSTAFATGLLLPAWAIVLALRPNGALEAEGDRGGA